MKIGIAGLGFVGSAVYYSLKTANKCQVIVYDKYKNIGSLKDILQADIIFICLPTPMGPGGLQDAEELKYFLYDIIEYEKQVVIKSTVIYQNIEYFIDKIKIVMNPEFLNANTSYTDFIQQNLIILGGNIKDCAIVADVYREYFHLDQYNFEFMSVNEAINFKYVHNIYHAYNVLFWNYVSDITGNHRKYVDLYTKLYGREPILWRVGSDGKRGYGGACFPKDVNAMRWSRPHMLTTFMSEYNKSIRED